MRNRSRLFMAVLCLAVAASSQASAGEKEKKADQKAKELIAKYDALNDKAKSGPEGSKIVEQLKALPGPFSKPTGITIAQFMVRHNLRMIALATHNYHDAAKTWKEIEPNANPGFMHALLPYIEQQNLASPAGKWEYKVMTDAAIRKLGKDDMTAGLNVLGADSWELVSVHQAQYIFKRPSQLPLLPITPFKPMPLEKKEPIPAAPKDKKTASAPLGNDVRLTSANEEPSGLELSTSEKKLVDMTNAERKKNKLPSLRPSARLFQVGRAHAANMAKHNKMEHVLDGKNPLDRVRASGYKFATMAENIAYLSEGSSLDRLMKMWMDSKIHRDNILSNEVTEIGVGIARNDGRVYYTEIFAKPR